MLIKILIIPALVCLVLAILTAMRPKDFRYVRHATLPAPPALVFPHVNEPRAWQAWSPWEKLDPALQRTYEGPMAGVGASYAWVGNNQVGSGRMTVIESRAAELIRFRLEFIKPFPATNTAEFTFQAAGEGKTTVTWSMAGQSSFICRGFGLFMNMERMVGRQFEQGLANLGVVVACQAKP